MSLLRSGHKGLFQQLSEQERKRLVPVTYCSGASLRGGGNDLLNLRTLILRMGLCTESFSRGFDDKYGGRPFKPLLFFGEFFSWRQLSSTGVLLPGGNENLTVLCTQEHIFLQSHQNTRFIKLIRDWRL